jgi:hypothetical protein
MAVPRVVPQSSDFNNLQCQTSLTALTGAKGIFLSCQTGKSNARGLHHVRFTSESGHLHCTSLCLLCANSGIAMILILTSTVYEAYSFSRWNTVYLKLEFLLWKTT